MATIRAFCKGLPNSKNGRLGPFSSPFREREAPEAQPSCSTQNSSPHTETDTTRTSPHPPTSARPAPVPEQAPQPARVSGGAAPAEAAPRRGPGPQGPRAGAPHSPGAGTASSSDRSG